MSRLAHPHYPSTDLIITAWYSNDECSAILSDLFSQSPSKKHYSLGVLCAWAARLGNKLPVAIECTYSLIASQRALLDEHIPYSEAVSRAANALTRALFLLTEKQQHQRASFRADSNARTPLPLHVLAEELGVPEWVVEIRHDSVHGRLASRPLLLRATELLIDAVRKHYWDALKRQCSSSSDSQSLVPDGRVSFIKSTHNVMNRLLETLRQQSEDTSSSPPPSKRSRKERSDMHADFRALFKQCAGSQYETDLFACLLASEYSALLIEPLSSSADSPDEQLEKQRELCFLLLETLASQKLLAAFWREACDRLLLQLRRRESSRGQLAQSLAASLTRVLHIGGACGGGADASGFEKRLRQRVFTPDATRQLLSSGAGASLLQRVVRSIAESGARTAPDATGRALLSLLEALVQSPEVQLTALAKEQLLDACRAFLRLGTDAQAASARPVDENALCELLAPVNVSAATASAAATERASQVAGFWQRDRSGTEWARFALGTCPSLHAPGDFSQLVLSAPESPAPAADEDDCMCGEPDTELLPPLDLRESQMQGSSELRKSQVNTDFMRRVDDAIRILPI